VCLWGGGRQSGIKALERMAEVVVTGVLSGGSFAKHRVLQGTPQNAGAYLDRQSQAKLGCSVCVCVGWGGGRALVFGIVMDWEPFFVMNSHTSCSTFNP